MNWLSFFDINHVFFEILNYPVSYIEFVGTLAGIIAVFLAAKSNIYTWPIGLINIVLFFIIFYRVHLYSDMFLQVYFFAIGIYGWIYWLKKNTIEVKIKLLSHRQRIQWSICIVLATLLLGFCISKIHIWLPTLFPNPAAFAYADTFVAVTSVVANTLMARRILENWILWILVDIICVYLYFSKGIIFVSFEYLIFLGLAIYGHIRWLNEYKVELSKKIIFIR